MMHAWFVYLGDPSPWLVCRILHYPTWYVAAAAHKRQADMFPVDVRMSQAELSERKTFLSDSKQVLLDASDALDGQQTKNKMAQDDRSVGRSVQP